MSNVDTSKIIGARNLADYDPKDIMVEIWHVDDIVEQSEGTLTKDEARQVLENIANDHDASIGINWDSIQFAIDQYKEQLKEAK